MVGGDGINAERWGKGPTWNIGPRDGGGRGSDVEHRTQDVWNFVPREMRRGDRPMVYLGVVVG